MQNVYQDLSNFLNDLDHLDKKGQDFQNYLSRKRLKHASRTMFVYDAISDQRRFIILHRLIRNHPDKFKTLYDQDTHEPLSTHYQKSAYIGHTKKWEEFKEHLLKATKQAIDETRLAQAKKKVGKCIKELDYSIHKMVRLSEQTGTVIETTEDLEEGSRNARNKTLALFKNFASKGHLGVTVIGFLLTAIFVATSAGLLTAQALFKHSIQNILPIISNFLFSQATYAIIIISFILAAVAGAVSLFSGVKQCIKNKQRYQNCQRVDKQSETPLHSKELRPKVATTLTTQMVGEGIKTKVTKGLKKVVV